MEISLVIGSAEVTEGLNRPFPARLPTPSWTRFTAVAHSFTCVMLTVVLCNAIRPC